MQPVKRTAGRRDISTKRSGVRRNRSGRITRTKILDAAEQVFIKHGIDGTSLRQIMLAADVNIAAIHYYFGNKDDLLRAVVRRRAESVKNERLNLVEAALASDGGASPLEKWLDAWMRPYVEGIRSKDSNWRHFLLILYPVVIAQTTNPVSAELVRETYDDVRDRYMETLARVLPHLPPADISWRYQCLVAVLRFCIVTRFRNAVAAGDGVQNEDFSRMVTHITPFLLGGLTAPPPLSEI